MTNKNILPSLLKNVSGTITGLDMSGSIIPTVFGKTLSGLQQLTYLSLQNCSVQKLKRDSFSGLVNLRTLKLNMNNITSLPDGVFYNLRDLDQLDLGWNPLTEVDFNTLIGLDSVTHLRLTGTALDSLDPVSFHPLQNLKALLVDLSLVTKFKEILLKPKSFRNHTHPPAVVVEGNSSLPCDSSLCWLKVNSGSKVKVRFLFEGHYLRPNCSENPIVKWDEANLHCSGLGKIYFRYGQVRI